MSNNELKDLMKTLDANHKELATKYNVLVKRTNSIINSVKDINEKLEFIADKLSMLDFMEQDDEDSDEDFNPYSLDPEDYEEVDNDDEDFD